jgi:purine catabolism regulator
VLTVADVLAMPVLRAADPVVVAGQGSLGQIVRWVHTTELPDIASLLRGGDLVLTTGIALSDSSVSLRTFALSLADSRSAGLVVELGRRWQEVPPALVEACEEVGLPLVVLRRVIRFAAVAQAVGERIVDEQLTELREAKLVHEIFTELSVNEAGADEILEAVQRLSGSAVVLEGGNHRIVDLRSGPQDIGPFVEDWERRSRSVDRPGRTGWDESNGWLLTQVGRRERGWGRLVIETHRPPSERLVAVAERAAAALALHLLHNREHEPRQRRLHHELLLGLLDDASRAELERRCELAGMPTKRRRFVGLALRPAWPDPAVVNAAAVDDVVAASLHAAESAGAAILVTVIDDEVRALLSFGARADAEAATSAVVSTVNRRAPVVAAAGFVVEDLRLSGGSLVQAQQVLGSVGHHAPAGVVHRLEDVHVRGLLTLLGTDPRIRAFAERELARLEQHERGPDLLIALRALLDHPESKSAAAQSLGVSRPVLYDQVARIERILGVDLADAEIRTSLHLALLAKEVLSGS